MRQSINNKTVINKGIKAAQTLAKEHPDLRAGFNIQVGKMDITVLFGLSEGAGKKGGKR